MKIRNYMKKREKTKDKLVQNQQLVTERFCVPNFNKKHLALIGVLFFIPAVTLTCLYNKGSSVIGLSDVATVSVESAPMTAVSTKKGTIAIPSGVVKANPFVPYREVKSSAVINDVPDYVLVEPPAASAGDSDALRIMDTTVSGILFDKYSPSAILNIEGNDYLVKKGDVVNNYHVVSIMQDSVTVKLGSNVYKAGIGEILTEGTLNHNNVSNLNNKFGGVNNEL